MRPKNFPSRKAARKAGVKRASRPPHVADTSFRLGRAQRHDDNFLAAAGEQFWLSRA